MAWRCHCWPTGTPSMAERPPISVKASFARRRPPTPPSWRASWMRSTRSRLRPEPGLVIRRGVDIAKRTQLRIDGEQFIGPDVAHMTGGQQALDAALAGVEQAFDPGREGPRIEGADALGFAVNPRHHGVVVARQVSEQCDEGRFHIRQVAADDKGMGVPSGGEAGVYARQRTEAAIAGLDEAHPVKARPF